MGFRSCYLHPAVEQGCGSCHVEEGGKLRRKDQKTACYGCLDFRPRGSDNGIEGGMPAPTALW